MYWCSTLPLKKSDLCIQLYLLTEVTLLNVAETNDNNKKMLHTCTTRVDNELRVWVKTTAGFSYHRVKQFQTQHGEGGVNTANNNQ